MERNRARQREIRSWDFFAWSASWCFHFPWSHFSLSASTTSCSTRSLNGSLLLLDCRPPIPAQSRTPLIGHCFSMGRYCRLFFLGQREFGSGWFHVDDLHGHHGFVHRAPMISPVFHVHGATCPEPRSPAPGSSRCPGAHLRHRSRHLRGTGARAVDGLTGFWCGFMS